MTIGPSAPEMLNECRRRLDALLPEQDAAVFGANNGLKAGTWERAFVEAIAVAHKAVDALVASEKRLEAAEKAVAEAKGLLGSAREGSRVWEHRRYDWFAALAGEK